VSTTCCRSCGAPLTIGEPIPRDAECGSCGSDLRSCVNCRHYDPRLHNACRETEAEQVEDRRRRNFCEYFEPSREPWAPGSGDAAQDARAKLDRLFGGAKSPAPPSSTAREKLEGLFKKRPPE
jgi:hypothetical protein